MAETLVDALVRLITALANLVDKVTEVVQSELDDSKPAD